MRGDTAFLGVPLIPLRLSGGGAANALCARRHRVARPRARARMCATEGGGSEVTVGFALSDASSTSFAELSGDFSTFARPGAYAIRDEFGELQYVGYAKDVGRRLEIHEQNVPPSQCVTFQTYLPDLPRADISPDLLEGVLEYWVGENGAMPKGNTVERAVWEGGEAAPDRKVLYAAVFFLFFAHSLVKQFLYHATWY